MNCPNCNKEVSPEWNVCPHCGYKPVKCSDPNCDSGWLQQEAQFCPICGRKTTAEELKRRRKAEEEEQRKRADEARKKEEQERQKQKEEAQRSTSTKTVPSSTTSSSSSTHHSSHTSSRSSSSSSSFGKRIGRFLGAVVAGIGAVVFMTDGGFSFFLPGIPLAVTSISLLVGAFTKD